MKTQIIEHIINLWPENKSEKQKYLDEVWNMIETAYEPIGGCNCDKSELLDDNVYWKLSKRNGKIVCAFLYKLTKFGRKMFLLATDGTQQGGKDLRKIVEEDIKQLDRNFYTEVSGKPEYLYLNRGAQKVPASRARYILGPTKEITPSDDEYHYERKIGPSKVQHTKIMLGNPKAEESIQESFESNAYMIRDDGKYYPVTIHPYGSDDIEETAWAAEWLYNHTNNNDTKQKCLQLIKYWIEKIVCWDLDLSEPNVKEVSEYLDDIGYIVVTGKFVKEHWDDIMAQQSIDNPTNLNNEVNKLLNNEFLRFRYGGRLDTEKGSKEAVFRISSSGFNWFDIIWEFVYNHKNEIDSVTICKDLESTGKEDFYKHSGKEFNKMPVDEFITLSGRPIVEDIINKRGKSVKDNKVDGDILTTIRQVIYNKSNGHDSNYSVIQLLCDLINRQYQTNLDPRDYTLHHINGNHTDTTIDNIILIKNKPDDDLSHGKLHHKLEVDLQNKIYRLLKPSQDDDISYSEIVEWIKNNPQKAVQYFIDTLWDYIKDYPLDSTDYIIPSIYLNY